jgi:hypothetical protein
MDINPTEDVKSSYESASDLESSYIATVTPLEEWAK